MDQKKFVDHLKNLWNSSVPVWLCKLVWGIAIFGFLLLAARFTFLGINFHGLPKNEKFWLFWLVAFSFIGIGWFQWRRVGMLYLLFFPLLLAVDFLKFLPVGHLVIHSLNFIAIGWILRGLIQRLVDFQKLCWADFLVGCIAASATISIFYGLIHPSWVNSFSVAFSAFDWTGEMNEFNSLGMGHNFLAACVLFLILRVNCMGTNFDKLFKIILFQITVCVFLWIVGQSLNLIQDSKEDEISYAFPFDGKHGVSMYALMSFALLLGCFSFRFKKIADKTIFTFIIASLILMLILAGSKIAWMCIPIIFVFATIHARKGIWLLGVLLLTALIGLGIYSVIDIKSILPKNVIYEIDLMVPEKMSEAVTFTHRICIYKNVLEIIKNFPFSGLGFGSAALFIPHFPIGGFLGGLNWSIYADPDSTYLFFSTHNFYNAHNDFLEIAVSMGFPGLLLFVTLLVFILLLTFNKSPENSEFEKWVSSGIFLVFLSYIAFASFNSMTTTFPGCIILFQFLALGVCVTTAQKTSNQIHKMWLWPAFVPFVLLIGAIWTLLNSSLPKNQSYGIWNWHMKDEKGAFLLAREAQFVVPPCEKLVALTFRLPEDAPKSESKILVLVDGKEVKEVSVNKSSETIFPLTRDYASSEWIRIQVNCMDWCGRGAFGSPFGVKPYAVAMRKIRPAAPERNE